jgi:hypothetical protein
LAKLASLFYGSLRGMRRTVKAHGFLVDQRGQAITEYLIVVVLAIIPLLGFTTPLRMIIRAYLRDIYFMISLSIF